MTRGMIQRSTASAHSALEHSSRCFWFTRCLRSLNRWIAYGPTMSLTECS